MSGPRIGSLCSGYSGLEMGVQSVIGGTTAWVSDIDKGACKILAHRFPEVPNVGDMTAVAWSTVEPVDVITGGTPCQDLSHAGKRAGMSEGTRSNLWVAMREAIATIRPSLVVWENVGGAYSAAADSEMERRAGLLGDRPGRPALRALGRVLGDLASLGYDASWHGIRAADVGAPHGRLRVFVLAWDASQSARRGPEQWHLEAPPQSAAEPREPTSETALLPLLPTPAVNDMGEGKTVEAWDEWTAKMKAAHGNGNGHGASLSIEAQRLLPTPSVADSLGGHLSRSGDRSNELLLPGVAKEIAHANPTEARPGEGLPDVRDASDAQAVRERSARGPDGVPQSDALLSTVREQPQRDSARQPQVAGAADRPEGFMPGVRDERPPARTSSRPQSGEQRPGEPQRAVCLMPPDPALAGGLRGPCGCGTAWGQYEAAIRRWERVLGRCAPPPTQLGPKGGPRLDARFSEFLMGLPAGWVTDVPGITRNEALRALGNGVVPQQAAAALREMFAWEVAA